MKLTESRLLIDSSAWLEYFLAAEPRIARIINEADCTLFSCAVSLHEIKKRLLFAKTERAKILQSLDFVRDNSIIVDVSEDIFEKSADDSFRLGLPLADSLVYRSALENNAQVITFDAHFSGKKGTIVLKG